MVFLFLVLYPLLPPPPACLPNPTHTHTPTTLRPSGVPLASLGLRRWLLRGRRGIWCSAQGSDVRPGPGVPQCPSGVPWSPPLCRWLLRGRRGIWCSAEGSDVRPSVPRCPSGVPWSQPLCRWLLRGRRGTWCTRHTYRSHTTKHTCTCTYIHTYTQTHPPSPLHHSYTSSSLIAFLCSVYCKPGEVVTVPCGVIRSYHFVFACFCSHMASATWKLENPPEH